MKRRWKRPGFREGTVSRHASTVNVSRGPARHRHRPSVAVAHDVPRRKSTRVSPSSSLDPQVSRTLPRGRPEPPVAGDASALSCVFRNLRRKSSNPPPATAAPRAAMSSCRRRVPRPWALREHAQEARAHPPRVRAPAPRRVPSAPWRDPGARRELPPSPRTPPTPPAPPPTGHTSPPPTSLKCSPTPPPPPPPRPLASPSWQCKISLSVGACTVEVPTCATGRTRGKR